VPDPKVERTSEVSGEVVEVRGRPRADEMVAGGRAAPTGLAAPITGAARSSSGRRADRPRRARPWPRRRERTAWPAPSRPATPIRSPIPTRAEMRCTTYADDLALFSTTR